MEGAIKSYKNFISGYIPAYLIIKDQYFILQKSKTSREKSYKVSLWRATVENLPKGESTDFIVTLNI